MNAGRYLAQVAQSLKALDAILDKAEGFALESGIGETALLQTRLAEDMFPLVRQVQIVTDNAKGAAARLSGQEIPSFADTEVSIADLRARLTKTIAFVEGVSAAELVGAEQRHITLAFMPGVYLTGEDYLAQFAVPNFYFHMTTAYGLLRMRGMKVGKMDFLGGLNLHPVAS